MAQTRGSGLESDTLWEEIMNKILATTVAAAALVASVAAAGATELRLSHQWSNKDVRHKVAQIVADEGLTSKQKMDRCLAFLGWGAL